MPGIIPNTFLSLVNGINILNLLTEFLKLNLENNFLCWQKNKFSYAVFYSFLFLAHKHVCRGPIELKHKYSGSFSLCTHWCLKRSLETQSPM